MAVTVGVALGVAARTTAEVAAEGEKCKRAKSIIPEVRFRDFGEPCGLAAATGEKATEEIQEK